MRVAVAMGDLKMLFHPDASNDKESTVRFWVSVGALALTFGILAFVSLHTVGVIKDAAVHAVLNGEHVSPGLLLRALGLADVVALSFLLLAVAMMVWLERQRYAFTALLATAPRGPFLVALAILLAWLGHSYAFSGLLLGGDTGSHIARFFEIRRGLEHGILPQRTNYQYLASPLLGFTGPLTYVVGGAVDLLVRDSAVTAKLLLFVLHMVAGWLCYALLRRWGIGCFGAAVGALGFAGSFAHLHLFLYRGVFPQAFTICFFLLAFLTAEGLMRRAPLRWRDWAGFAFATAGLIVNHQPHAPFVAAYLLIFGLVSLWLGRWQLAGAVGLASAGLLGVAMSAVAVVPVIFESDWVMIEPANAMFNLNIPGWERLLHLVLWQNTRITSGTDYWAYLGIVLVVLAVVGLGAATLRRLPSARLHLVAAIVPCLGVSFFLANPVVRDVMFLLLFVTVPAAVGAEWLAERFARWPRLPVLIVGALLLDLSSTSVQPLARTDKQYFIEAGHYLERVAPNQRVMEISWSSGRPAGSLTGSAEELHVDASFGPGATPLVYDALVQRISGNHNMAATRVHNYALAVIKQAETDLRGQGALSERTADLLALLNVTRIICVTARENGCPLSFSGSVVDGPLGRVVPVGNATPVLFSRRLVTVPAPGDLDKPMFWVWNFDDGDARVPRVFAYLDAYLANAQPDLVTRQAARLPVFGPPAQGVAADSPGEDARVDEIPWHPALTDYAVSLETVTAVVDTDRAGYVQLAHPWFPATIVRVNGVPVTPLEGALHLIVVPIEPGVSRIEIVPTITPVRRVSAFVSLAALTLTLAVPAIGWLRGRRRARTDGPQVHR